jgi:hypothetical protein
MSDVINLHFRPESYFGPERLEKYLLSQVKGAVIRKRLQALFKEGRHSEARELLGVRGISARDRKALEAFHPAFMGGNYLPDTDTGEVEIARITLASTTYDVTSVYARAEAGVLRYRVVDEYEGDTLTGKVNLVSKKPLTLGELADFFLGAWDLVNVLRMNLDYDADIGLEFYSVESKFYPDLDRLITQRVLDHVPELVGKTESDDEGE